MWTMVCGVKIYLPVARLGHILQCTATGPELDEIEVNMDIEARDEVTHRFLVDDIRGLRSSQLRPQARLLHRALIRSVTPRTGSYEEVRKINFQSLYAVYSSQQVNWARNQNITLNKIIPNVQTFSNKFHFKNLYHISIITSK
ncbi:hypothetical protein RBK84_04675, partial [Pseudomonas aeruginosa]|uniref:hypothetical protein n=1 Tax=Pseudomonas aeruginosa TaxID=287 RepID=UPI0027D3883C